MILCPICKAKTKLFCNVRGNISVPSDKRVYKLRRCVFCDHVFRVNHLDLDIYDEAYYAYSASGNLLEKFAAFLFSHRVFLPLWRILQFFTRYQNVLYVKDGKVLDVGGGDGFVLNLYKRLENKTYNIEILDWVVEASRKNGHVTYKDFSKFKNIRFDLIRINQVLEHVDNPKKLVSDCYKLLKRNGVLIIGIPNIHSWSFSLFKDNFDQLSFPDHIHFFSEDSLRILLKDFTKVQIKYSFHRYGVLTNLYNIMVQRVGIKSPFVSLGSILVSFLSLPLNLTAQILKRSHFIDIKCVK